MLALLTDGHAWASLATLIALEIVLGIDNVIFVSLAANRLAPSRRLQARALGLGVALALRIVLLASLSWIISLREPVLTLFGIDLSWRDLVLIAGGLFLLTKGTREIHHTVEGEDGKGSGRAGTGFLAVVGQIVVIDIVFSLDSVITAVGMAEHLEVMIAAVVVAMGAMLAASGPIATFIDTHPTAKMLALSFLLLVGVALVADGLQFHIPRGYIYFAVAFSSAVEALNLWMRRRHDAAGRGDGAG